MHKLVSCCHSPSWSGGFAKPSYPLRLMLLPHKTIGDWNGARLSPAAAGGKTQGHCEFMGRVGWQLEVLRLGTAALQGTMCGCALKLAQAGMMPTTGQAA